MQRVVFMKQSGEALGAEGAPFDDEAIHDAAVRIKHAYAARDELGLAGLTVVAGGGNIMRGGSEASPTRDFVGRMATIANTLVLEEALRRQDVPVSLFMAPGTMLYDRASDINPLFYDASLMTLAHRREEVALLANGMGINGQTTDSATAQCATDYMTNYRSEGSPHGELQATVLKSTRFDGVYSADPARDEAAKRFRVISAPQMVAEYQNFGVVDRTSLDELIENDLTMTVFSGEHSLVDVLREDYTQSSSKGIGTLIVPHFVQPSLYQD